VELDLTRGVPETTPSTLFRSTSRRSHLDLVRVIQSLSREDTTKGVFIRLGTASVGLARAHELGRLLGGIRKAGRPVVCHADDFDNGTMLLASLACSKLWVSPAGQVGTVGIAAQLLFANKLLGKLNVDVDFLQVGKYKGASEPFTRDAPSPEARESLEGTLRGMRAAWLSGITEGSGKEALAELVEDGPFPAEEAKAKGLVHEVGYVDDAREDAKKLADAPFVATRFGGSEQSSSTSGGILDVFRSISGASHAGTPHVAVVSAVGSISMGSPDGLPFGGGDGIGERELGRVLTKLLKDESTKAVVLRIDSPGGSALASDLLWKKLMKLRASKPVVVSIGSMAASGGYYLACTASKIVAEPTSIVGSIGVVAGKLAVGRALEDIGVHAETVAAAPDPKKAARATYMSALSPWDEATEAKVLVSMQSIYDLFLRRVAEGRGIDVAKVAASAEGRIFAGAEAKDRGLVDQLGGFQDALKLAIELAKLPEDAPVDILGDSPGLFDLFGVDDEMDNETSRGEALAAAARREAMSALLPTSSAAAPELTTFLGAMSPLFAGERTLAAVPFAIVVR
jgi:protease-4